MSPACRTSRSPDETRALGAKLGALLPAGTVLALTGSLGAGKTVFVQGLARGLGVDPREPVVSPTFVLLRTYTGRVPLYHLDAYRLAGAGELLDLGVLDFLGAEGQGVTALEWADRVPEALPVPRLELVLEVVGESERELTLSVVASDSPVGARYIVPLQQIVEAWAKA